MNAKIDARNAGTLAIADTQVARIGFGARPLSGPSIWPKRWHEAQSVLHHAIELGINFIDTANIYGAGVSEMQIAEALYPYENVLIATKAGMSPRNRDGSLGIDGDPERLKKRCDESLERLGIDCIPLFQIHIPDPKVPWEEQVGALRDLQVEGKVRYIGLCNVNLEQVRAAQRIAKIVSVQNGYNLASPGDEEVLRYCESNQIAFIAHRPLGNGKLAESPQLQRVAQKHSVSPFTIGVAWLLKQSKSLMTIPGTSTISHLEVNVQAASITLTEEDLLDLRQGAAAV